VKSRKWIVNCHVEFILRKAVKEDGVATSFFQHRVREGLSTRSDLLLSNCHIERSREIFYNIELRVTDDAENKRKNYV